MCIRDRLKTPGIRVAGIHCHIGSQIFDIDPFCHAAEVMLGFAQQVRAELGYKMCIRDRDYIKYMGGDTAKFREGFKEQAEKQVKIRLALEALAAAEGLSLIHISTTCWRLWAASGAC